MQRHKDVTLGDTKYQIGLLSALDGSWILGRWTEKWSERRLNVQVITAAATEAKEGPVVPSASSMPSREEGTMAMATFLIPKLTREELAEVQEICLSRCSRYEEAGGREVAMPIMAGRGQWAVAELEYNAPVVLRLTQESIAFNIAPFFRDAGSSAPK